MEVKINVDETMFKDILEKELEAFSKEELHEIIREAIIESMKADNFVRDLFTTKELYSQYKPSQVMIEAAKSIDLSPAYKEIQEKIITELKENYHQLLEKVMLDMIVEGLTNSWGFQQSIQNGVYDVVHRMGHN